MSNKTKHNNMADVTVHNDVKVGRITDLPGVNCALCGGSGRKVSSSAEDGPEKGPTTKLYVLQYKTYRASRGYITGG